MVAAGGERWSAVLESVLVSHHHQRNTICGRVEDVWLRSSRPRPGRTPVSTFSQARRIRSNPLRSHGRVASSRGGGEPLSGFTSSGALVVGRSEDMNKPSFLAAVATAFWHQVSSLTNGVIDG